MSDMKTCAQCGGALLYGVVGYGGRICQCKPTVFHSLQEQEQAQTIAELVEALEFYANKKNWHKDSQEYGSFEVSDYNIIYNDFYEQNQATRYAGKVAVETLAKVKGK